MNHQAHRNLKTKNILALVLSLFVLLQPVGGRAVHAADVGTQEAIGTEKKLLSTIEGYASFYTPSVSENCKKISVNLTDTPAFIDESLSGWAVKIGTEFYRVSEDDKFVAGDWRYEICIRLNAEHVVNGQSGETSAFNDDVTVTISEETWGKVSEISTLGHASWLIAASPELTIKESVCEHEWTEGLSTASCGKGGVQYYYCAKCGESKTEARPATQEHTFCYESSETECYQICETCGFMTDKAEHNFCFLQKTGGCTSGVVRKACKNCGYETTKQTVNEHTWSEGYAYDDLSHFKYCTVCGEKDETTIEFHEGDDVCTTCDAPIHGLSSYLGECVHGRMEVVYETTTESSTESEGQQKSGQTVKEVVAHANEWLVAVEKVGNCKSGISAHFYCPVCEKLLTDGENPVETDIADLRYEGGDHVYENACAAICHNCGEKRNASHAFSENFYADGGMHYYACQRCSAKYCAEPHDLTDWISEGEKKCGAKLGRHIECRVCGMEIARDEVVVTHEFSSWTVKKATCMEEGYATRACTICGEKQTFTLQMISHQMEVFTEPYHDETSGTITHLAYICTQCQNFFDDPEGKYMQKDVPKDIDVTSSESMESDDKGRNAEEKTPIGTVPIVLLILGPAMMVVGIVLLVVSGKKKKGNVKGDTGKP